MPDLHVADSAPANTLPAEVTTFVGRREDLARAKRTLENARLLTLTGVGGVGKTRLALRLATEKSRAFRHGVWLIDLTPLTEPELVTVTVAQSLGIRNQSARPALEILVEYVRDQNALLVLDNCEHLVQQV